MPQLTQKQKDRLAMTGPSKPLVEQQQKRIAELEAEVERLTAEYRAVCAKNEKLRNQVVLTLCPFCLGDMGDDVTALKQHILTCEKHPLKTATDELKRLRDWLAKLEQSNRVFGEATNTDYFVSAADDYKHQIASIDATLGKITS